MCGQDMHTTSMLHVLAIYREHTPVINCISFMGPLNKLNQYAGLTLEIVLGTILDACLVKVLLLWVLGQDLA